jgi:hypothetical protein
LGRLGNQSSRAGSTPPFCKTGRRARGLDSVARDNPADSLMPQDRWCLPFPYSTGPGPTRQGVGPAWGRAPASDRWLNQVGHLHPAGCSTVHGAPPLSASQAGFGLSAGCPRFSRARANRCCVPTTAEGDSDGSHWDAVPLGMACPGGHQVVSVDLPVGQASGGPPRGGPGTAGAPSGSGMSDHLAGPLQHACGPRDGKFYKSPKR